MQNKNMPIGIFDSGVGGLSVWSVLYDFLPNESFIYFADSKNAPYGNKSKNEIINRSIQITDFLLNKGAKLIVVACNTATAAAIEKLRSKYPNIPFVGMEPAIKPASLLTKTGNIGVLATNGTFKGDLFKKNQQKYEPYISIHFTEGKGLVEIAENNNIYSDKAMKLLKSYIEPMIKNNVDQLVLGCTHYPLFIPVIEKITENKINIIDPAHAIAKRTKDLLFTHLLVNNDNEYQAFSSFYTNGNISIITHIIKLLKPNYNPENLFCLD